MHKNESENNVIDSQVKGDLSSNLEQLQLYSSNEGKDSGAKKNRMM